MFQKDIVEVVYMNKELQDYLDSISTPWGMMFYNMVWKQIGEVKGLRILDFGSGFCVTANHYAKENTVIAVDPNPDMIRNRVAENEYEQVTGGIEILKDYHKESFDLIICHNVLEYVEDKEQYLFQFRRLIKKDGKISIVKHNHNGRIMSKIVFENDLEQAMNLLDGGEVIARNFGKIDYYDMNQLLSRIEGLKVNKVMGIRHFWGLQQNNESKYQNDWSKKMLEVEMKVSEMDDFRNIAFFHHVLLQTVSND